MNKKKTRKRFRDQCRFNEKKIMAKSTEFMNVFMNSGIMVNKIGKMHWHFSLYIFHSKLFKLIMCKLNHLEFVYCFTFDFSATD